MLKHQLMQSITAKKTLNTYTACVHMTTICNKMRTDR